MMPRPILKDNFGITYRKIPILSIGKEVSLLQGRLGWALELIIG
jgi:hypothetical protein